MLKIYDKDGNLSFISSNSSNVEIIKEINSLDRIKFNVSRDEGVRIQLEGYVEVEDHGRFIIKEVDLSNRCTIQGEILIERLEGTVDSINFKDLTANRMIGTLVSNKGWMVNGGEDNVVPSLPIKDSKIIDAIFEIAEDSMLEVKFDTSNKRILLGKKLGSDRGTYFHSELNLRNIHVSSDTYDYATRLIPRGKDGLSIESVNGGKDYIDNNTYSDKVITAYWIDSRYIKPSNLIKTAREVLENMATPYKSIDCDIVDLTSLSEYSFLDYDIGDTISLIDKDLRIQERHRIVRLSLFPNKPQNNNITLSNKRRDVTDRFITQDYTPGDYDDRILDLESKLGQYDEMFEDHELRISELERKLINHDDLFIYKILEREGIPGREDYTGDYEIIGFNNKFIEDVLDGVVPKEITFPNEVDGLRVSAINSRSYSGIYGESRFDGVEVINFSRSIARIESGSFTDISSIKSINLSEGLNYIGERAFMGSGLTELKTPNSLTTIGQYAFRYSRKLSKLSLNEGLLSIQGYAFDSCSLGDFVLPKTITRISEYAFSNNNIFYLSIPDSLEILGRYSFENNNITSFRTSNSSSLLEIRTRALKGNRLTSIFIPDSVIAIESGAFYPNPDINSVNLYANMIGKDEISYNPISGDPSFYFIRGYNFSYRTHTLEPMIY